MKRQAPRKDWLEINEAILEVIAIAQYQLRRNDILLETRLGDGLPSVRGDRVQLQQVLLNLIVNAIEAMSEDRPAAPRINDRVRYRRAGRRAGGSARHRNGLGPGTRSSAV